MEPTETIVEDGDADGSVDNSSDSSSESWTVLDCINSKEDIDISDSESVESVEVLANEEGELEPVTVVEKFKKQLNEDTPATSHSDDKVVTVALHTEATAAAAVVAANVAVAAATAHTVPPNPQGRFKCRLGTRLPRCGSIARIKLARCNWAQRLLLFFYKWIVIFIPLDIFCAIFICYSVCKMEIDYNRTKAELHKFLFEMDPLPVQMNRLVSGWNKEPSEEHDAARVMFKSLLAYYSNGDATSYLRQFHKAINVYDEEVKIAGQELGADHTDYKRMLTKARLAHAVFAVLKDDVDREFTHSNYKYVGNCSNKYEGALSERPEENHMLNDPLLESAEKAYNKSSSISKFYVSLGSPKWNEYYWNIYHEAPKLTEKVELNVEDPGEEQSIYSEKESQRNVTSCERNLNQSSKKHCRTEYDEVDVDKDSKSNATELEKGDEEKEAAKSDDPDFTIVKEDKKRRKQKRKKKKRNQGGMNNKHWRSVDRVESDTEIKDDNYFVKTTKKKRKKNKKKSRKYDQEIDPHLELSDIILNTQDFIQGEINFEEVTRDQENSFDWNTHMAQEREKLRALHQRSDWIFERSKARRKLREY